MLCYIVSYCIISYYIILDKEKPAAWFDAAVAQVDNFGRREAPTLANPRRFADCEEHAVSETLACGQPGCEAIIIIVVIIIIIIIIIIMIMIMIIINTIH